MKQPQRGKTAIDMKILETITHLITQGRAPLQQTILCHTGLNCQTFRKKCLNLQKRGLLKESHQKTVHRKRAKVWFPTAKGASALMLWRRLETILGSKT